MLPCSVPAQDRVVHVAVRAPHLPHRIPPGLQGTTLLEQDLFYRIVPGLQGRCMHASTACRSTTRSPLTKLLLWCLRCHGFCHRLHNCERPSSQWQGARLCRLLSVPTRLTARGSIPGAPFSQGMMLSRPLVVATSRSGA
jgi:hypothetical protein